MQRMRNCEPVTTPNATPLPGAVADADREAAPVRPVPSESAPPPGGISPRPGGEKDEPVRKDAAAAPSWRRLARNLAFAIVVNGLGSLLVTGAWWLGSQYVSSAKPTPKSTAI